MKLQLLATVAVTNDCSTCGETKKKLCIRGMANRLMATSNALPNCKQLQENYVEFIE